MRKLSKCPVCFSAIFPPPRKKQRRALHARSRAAEAGGNVEDFAAECGLDRTYMSGIEREKRNVALRNIDVIAKALKVTLSELMKGL